MRCLLKTLLNLTLALAVIALIFANASEFASRDDSLAVAQPADRLGAMRLAPNAAVSVPMAADNSAPFAALMTPSGPITGTTQMGQILFTPPLPPEISPSSIYGRIRGSAAFVRRIRATLDWLQAHDMEAYQRVDAYITVITPSPYARLAQAEPRPDGGCAVRALARRNMPVEMIAALLYHEASHCYQFATVGVLSSKEAEVFAYTEQIAFMERNSFPADEIEYYRQVLAYYASQPDGGQFVPPPDF